LRQTEETPERKSQQSSLALQSGRTGVQPIEKIRKKKQTAQRIMVILTPIEKLSKFFLHISQMLNVSTFGNMADIQAIVHLVPYTSAYLLAANQGNYV
jgi:hypothetical protein